MNRIKSFSQDFGKKKTIILSIFGVLILVAGIYLFSNGKTSEPEQIVLGGKEVMVYKTPTCGCCRVYVSYLEKKGVKVKTEDVKDLNDIKRQYGVPTEFSSCHTSIVDGYVVEGHIPLEAIEKLLNERPNIKGIALPGMPSGTPGMPGPKNEIWNIRSFTEDGTTGTFMSI